MKELVIQIRGNPWRILFCFDPNRHAVLLAGGEKTGDDRWYDINIPIADARFEQHLKALEEERRKAEQAVKSKPATGKGKRK